MNALLDKLRAWWFARAAETDTTLGKGIDIWTQGGWAMIALVAISVFIFAVGASVAIRLFAKRTGRVSEAAWRDWIRDRGARLGAIGEIFNRVDKVIRDSSSTVQDGFDEVRTEDMEPFVRDLRLMNIAVGAAPLVGLLGTVTGMLSTFDAMSTGGGGDKTMSMIAKGISEALYTTETGLMVALPGVFLHYYLSCRFEVFKEFLGHAESVWTQEVLLQEEQQLQVAQQQVVRGMAQREIAGHLLARLQSNPDPRPSAGAH